MKLLLVLVAITLLFLPAFADTSLLGNAADNLATINEANDALALHKKHSHGKINCKFSCKNRCKESSRKKICHRACTSCCKRCHCVPPGTYGNKKACPCYASLRTHANKPKCP